MIRSLICKVSYIEADGIKNERNKNVLMNSESKMAETKITKVSKKKAAIGFVLALRHFLRIGAKKPVGSFSTFGSRFAIIGRF